MGILKDLLVRVRALANEAMELLLSSSVSRHIRVLFSYFSWRFLEADESYYVVNGFQASLPPLFHLDPGRLFGTLHTDVHSSFALFFWFVDGHAFWSLPVGE